MSKGKLDLNLLSNIRLRNEVERVSLFNLESILKMTPEEYREKGNFSTEDVQVLKGIAAKTFLPQGFIRVLPNENNLRKQWLYISLDCPEIDQLLGGGLPCSGITELSGESGVGKTQICLQYSITVQYPIEHGGLGRSAVYICTEDKFPANRLHQLLGAFPRKDLVKGVMADHSFSDRIFVDHIADVEALKQCLCSRLPQMLKKAKVGLIIIDSIAALFRGEYGVNDFVARTNDLREIGVSLHRISKHFDAAVLCVNQVTDSVDSGTTVPCLGLTWANLVTTRLQAKFSPTRERTFCVINAPYIPPGAVPYKITSSGIVA